MTVTSQFFQWWFTAWNIGGWVVSFLFAIGAIAWIIYDTAKRRVRTIGWLIGAILPALLLLPSAFAGVSPTVRAQMQNLLEISFYLGLIGSIVPIVVVVGYGITYKGTRGCERGHICDASLGECPICAQERQAYVPPSPPPQPIYPEQEPVTVPPSRPAAGAYDEEETDFGFRARLYEEEEDITQLPERRPPDWDEDRTVVERTPGAEGLLGFLIVKEGMRRGKVYRVDNGTTIGRDRANIMIRDPKVSRPHAKFTIEGEQFMIWDFGSEDGTFLNNEQIQGATPLKENDIIKIGDTVFVLKIVDYFGKQGFESEPTVHRYSEISFPAYTRVGQSEALIVAVALRPTDERAVELVLKPSRDKVEPMEVDACIAVSPLDFDLEGPNVQAIEVPLLTDSAPMIFKLVPKSVGRKTIAVEFFQNARYLGRAEVKTTVGEKTRTSQTVSAQFALALRPRQLAPDLTIYIEEVLLDKTQRLYRFLLLSPIHELNLSFEEAGEIELQTAPEVYFEELFVELNEWLRGSGVDEDIFFKRLNGLGANLYDQLFPDKLKRIYWDKLHGKVETVQIISADPWIPWELVRPYHPDTLEEDDFLCEQFALTRWLAGKSSPDAIDFRKLALVVAASNLQSVLEEAEALRKLPGIQVQDVPPSLLDVYDLLETGGFNGLHFACHGKYDRRNPDQSVVLLEGGQRFRPNDIAGKKRTFGRDEPLVFLNACETGRAGLSLTGMGGWARAFIQAGAGGFVGSIWEAHDESACKFAVAFYGYLLRGKIVAEAARLARRSIRRAGDPTWLSYTVYANPLARLAVGAAAQG